MISLDFRLQRTLFLPRQLLLAGTHGSECGRAWPFAAIYGNLKGLFPSRTKKLDLIRRVVDNDLRAWLQIVPAAEQQPARAFAILANGTEADALKRLENYELLGTKSKFVCSEPDFPLF